MAFQDQAAEDAEKMKKDSEEAEAFVDSLSEDEKAEAFKMRDQIAVEGYGAFSGNELSQKFALVEAVKRMRASEKERVESERATPAERKLDS